MLKGIVECIVLASGLTLAAAEMGRFGPPPDRTSAGEPICHLDLTELCARKLDDPRQAREAWDALHLAASLQGIVNRKGPRLFIRFMAETDDFWFDWCTVGSGWLARRPVERFSGIDGLFKLVERFAGEFAGVVSYPEKPFALSNVASTVAGAEGRLAIREDADEKSLYRRFIALSGRPRDELKLGGRQIRPKAGSCGSAKNDVYRWAKERYLDAGRCGASFMVRTILKSPTWHAETGRLLREKTGGRVCIVDPRSFFELARRAASLR